MVTPTYKSWSSMKQRCDNPTNKDYINYGGRGITYDPRWKAYSAFREDMGKKPEDLSLDRINNNSNYTKENCKWSTKIEQNNNRRDRIRGVERKDNSSGVPGVFQDKRRGTWYARVYEKGSPINIYCGPSKEEAIVKRLSYQNRQNSQPRDD